MEIVLTAIGCLGMLAWGDWLLARLVPRFSNHPLERALTGFGLIFGAGAYFIHGLGFAGLLYKPLAYAIILLCLAGIVVWLAERAHKRDLPSFLLPAFSGLSPSDRLLLAGVCLYAAINLAGCLTPEIRDDCLINHLGIPAGFANAHRIEIHPFNMNMGRPQLIHMYYILSLLFQNVFGAKLIHTMLALVGLAAMGWLAARTCEKRATWPSLYLFYSLPVVTLYATCSYIDLGRIYFEVFPLWLILRYQQDRRRMDLALAATIFGFGMGVHWLSSLFGWPALTATVFFAVLLGGGERRWRRAILAAAGFGLLSALIFSPWIIRNWLLMGNPSQALFRTPGGLDQAQHLNPEMGRFLQAFLNLPHGFYQTFWVITVSGNCPPILLAGALVLKFALRDRDPRRSAMLAFAFLYLLLFAITTPSQDGRYILPGFAVAVVLFFHYVERLLAGYGRYRAYLVGGVFLLGALNFAMSKYRLYTDYGEPPWPVCSPAAVEQFLARRMGDRTIIRYLNEQLPPGSKVLLDTMRCPLYVWRPFMFRNDADPRILNTLLRRTNDNDALLQALRGYRLTHILIAGEIPTGDLNEAQQKRLQEFVEKRLRVVFRAGSERLFEIVD